MEKQQQERFLGHDYKDEGFVFWWEDGQPYRPEWISNTFNRLVERTGLPTIRLHDLRHTHATHLLLAGVPTRVVSKRLGHKKSWFTEQTYQHVLPEMDQSAAGKPIGSSISIGWAIEFAMKLENLFR